ncbi:MAG: class I SAM-dependent methyltransferase [Proteobacteria bacterium]|nr:class I SAM-dependent methyltransferase [Pseudomonadota bacterium]
MELSVKEVYDKIATYFDVTRVRIWGSVRTFLESLPKDSYLLDVGAGNGKNMMYRPELKFKGIDFSKEQVRICQGKGLDVIEASMVQLPFVDNEFDNMICIASYHHLDNDVERQKSLNEMYRCLKPGGRILMTVWAMEQFEGSTFNFTKRDELVSWKSKENEVYYRYYHIYNKGDIEEEITRLEPRFKITEVGWEVGNWWVILEKS